MNGQGRKEELPRHLQGAVSYTHLDVYKRQTKTYYDGTVMLEGGTGQREMETRLELTSEGIRTTTLSKGIVLLLSLIHI